MKNYIEFFNIAGPVAAILIGLVLVAEVIKAGKIVYEFFATKVLKIQTKAAKMKEKKEQLTDLILKNNLDLQDFMNNQTKLNSEIKTEISGVREDIRGDLDNIRSDINDIRSGFNDLSNTVTDMQLESMRETILEFASALSSPNKNAYTKEQFTYVRKIYRQYTELIKKYDKTNDEVDLSMIIINDKYEYNVLHHTFVEDLVKDPDIKHDIDEKIENSKTPRKPRKRAITKKEDTNENDDNE